jgi:nicotinamidase-related amidase
MSTAIDKEPTPSFVPALIVVDMQHDFVHGSLAVPGAEAIIDTVNKVISLPGFKLKVATQDSHPNNHISFASTHNKPTFSTVTIYHPEDSLDKTKGIEQVLWPDHCVANTIGANFVKGLKSDSFDAIIHKGTHSHIESYSAFRDIWNKGETELPELLLKEKITDIFFVGLAGDYCVKYTAIDALDYGYNTWVVSDGIKSIADEEAACEGLKKKGALFLTSEELKQKLTSST